MKKYKGYLDMVFAFFLILFVIVCYFYVFDTFNIYNEQRIKEKMSFYNAYSFSEKLASGIYGNCKQSDIFFKKNYCYFNTFNKENVFLIENKNDCYFDYLLKKPHGECLFRTLIIDEKIEIIRVCCDG